MSDDLGDWELPYGKYEGETLRAIWLTDKDYLRWISKSFSNNSEVKQKVDEYLEEKE